MRKISLYLAVVVILGTMLTGYWVYSRYFSKTTIDELTLKAEKGDIQSIVSARGEVISQKEFNLEFPYSGIVEKIYVQDGDKVQTGDPLIKLETQELDLDLARLRAVLQQAEANLRKLQAGATLEDENVSRANVASARAALESAKASLVATITDAYTRSDDAVRNKVDPLFNNPRSAPQLSFTIGDQQLKTDIEALRLALEAKLNTWSDSLKSVDASQDLTTLTQNANANLTLVRALCDKATILLNMLTANAQLAQTTIDAWRVNVSAGRLAVGLAVTALSAAEEKVSGAQSALSIAQNQLSLKQAGTREEEIAAAKAQVDEVNSEIAATQDKIAKATLSAPASAIVTKVNLEQKEVFMPGSSAISLSVDALKLQSDISELDIGKLRMNGGLDVNITFDAFPDYAYQGKLLSIDAKEIIKEGDTFYRANIFFDPAIAQKDGNIVRTGMSADLKIIGEVRKNAIKISGIAVYKKGDKSYVRVVDNQTLTETEVKTGISDGESIEIIQGLKEGQFVRVSGNQ